MRSLVVFTTSVFLALAADTTAEAQTLRSSTPLWNDVSGRKALYPQSYVDAESFGCILPDLKLGVYHHVDAQFPDDPSFWRIENYGVVHCALTFGTAHDEEDILTSFEDFAWVANIGESRTINAARLMAIQIGVSGGSRYIILRSIPDSDRQRFDVLEAHCPSDAETLEANIDIWRQRVCVVESQDQLARIAREADTRTPAGRLEWISAGRSEKTSP